MSLRDRLRELLGVTPRDGPHAPKVGDEEILNVLRRHEDEYLATAEVRDELPIGEQTANRLNCLEGCGRVRKRKTGQGYLWALASTESQTVENPRLGPVVGWSAKMRRWSQELLRACKQVGGVGVALIILSMSAGVGGIDVPFVTWELGLAWGYVIATVAAAFLGVVGLLRLVALVAPRIVERLLLE